MTLSKSELEAISDRAEEWKGARQNATTHKELLEDKEYCHELIESMEETTQHLIAEIKRLTEENERFRATLDHISKNAEPYSGPGEDAREALQSIGDEGEKP